MGSGVTEVDGPLAIFCGGPPGLNIRAKYAANGAVNQDYYNTILFLVGDPNCWGPLVFDLTLPNGRYATAHGIAMTHATLHSVTLQSKFILTKKTLLIENQI